jgi:phosphonate transport system ATP-binding protein
MGRLTAVISLHQLELARRHADRIVALARGRVVFDGPPTELTDDDLNRIYGGTPTPADEHSPESDAPAPVSANASQVIENFEREIMVQDD